MLPNPPHLKLPSKPSIHLITRHPIHPSVAYFPLKKPKLNPQTTVKASTFRATSSSLSFSPWLQEELEKSRFRASSSLAKMAVSKNPHLELVFRSISSSLFFFLLLLLASFPLRSESSCRRGCDLAIASYYIPIRSQTDLTNISSLFEQDVDDVLPYNPRITLRDSIDADSRINVSFTCECLADGAFLGHIFSYQTVFGDTYTTIASTVYSNLTTEATLIAFNSYSPNRIPDGENINVTVNCSCGDADVSRDYGLFVTYPLRPGQNLSSVAAEWGFSGREDLLKRYNQGADFSAGEGIVFIPTKGQVFI